MKKPVRLGTATLIVMAVILVTVSLSPSGLANEETTPLPTLDVPEVTFRSVFVQDPRIGKDPFFPNSKRWVGEAAVVIAPEPKSDDGVVDWSLFELKGISLSPKGYLALINRYTFAQGEKQDMKMAGGLVISVLCESITQGSVIIRIKDEKHELTREVLK